MIRPRFLAPILAFAVVRGLHHIFGAFAGVVWRADGISKGWVGPLLIIGAGAELTAMFLFRRIA